MIQWGYANENNGQVSLIGYSNTTYTVLGSGMYESRAGMFCSDKTETSMVIRCTKDGSRTSYGGYWMTIGY